ncbi:hypothetical protein B0T26DRAFT_639280 [Lasiosphaeria miniovina]|uniref:Glycosyl transferase family 25 domain-containing protein n=1 Tax=Lasiosphaeria miniovina TaxID=1954250 RepID=A0AA40B771_9PEZI|nr:uncharacterized protein B0T26DRAFT_639280 [Lasiosphaeria miniovina]KAK0728874.1 hypothetical protein B0T26DRAFT_639280 [Lasiosphaeria miniovina]
MSREQVSTSGPAAALTSLFSQWRSYRQIHRVFLVLFVVSTIFVLDRYRVALAGTLGVPYRPPIMVQADDGPSSGHSEDTAIERAGNGTLGFHAIYYVNMKARYDREDAMALQAYISGLDIQDYPAVESDMIDPVGMPPTHRPGVLKVGERGCWRAHANIWSEMVRKKLPPVLIMESDATWDINVRPIMSNLNKHFVEFLRNINSTAVHDPSWRAKNNRHPLADDPHRAETYVPPNDATNGTATAAPTPAPTPIEFNVDDPWLSEHWDLFSIGQCFETNQDKDVNLVYTDQHVPAGKNYWGVKLGNQRVIRKSGGITCTTSYAISHTGAAKLLLRSSIDLDNPVDLLIRRMTLSRDLVAYSVQPPIVAQWEYRGDVGMNERGAQSDINGGKHKDTPSDAEMKGWDDVKKTGSVWTTKSLHHDVGFDRMALEVAWDQILTNVVLTDSWYNPVDKD